jgi:hypothetical protein
VLTTESFIPNIGMAPNDQTTAINTVMSGRTTGVKLLNEKKSTRRSKIP